MVAVYSYLKPTYTIIPWLEVRSRMMALGWEKWLMYVKTPDTVRLRCLSLIVNKMLMLYYIIRREKTKDHSYNI